MTWVAAHTKTFFRPFYHATSWVNSTKSYRPNVLLICWPPIPRDCREADRFPRAL